MSARSREPFVPAEDAIPYKSSVITHGMLYYVAILTVYQYENSVYYIMDNRNSISIMLGHTNNMH